MAIRVLFIDDEQASIEAVVEELKTSMPEADCKTSNFESADATIDQFQPDVVVLDLLQRTGAESFEDRGSAIGVEVWDRRFCPLIYYTGSAEDPEDHQHPLIAVVRKGSGSDVQVRDKIKTYLPQIAALNRVSGEISRSLRRALRESKPRVFEIDAAEQENQLLVRSIRRRVAASMDEAVAEGGPNLMSWEQYLCPPSNPHHFFTGDIFRTAGKDKDDPFSYRVVLTPSCDLVESESRTPKVTDVLLARCTRVQQILVDLNVNLGTNPKRKTVESARDKLSRLLTQGYGHSVFPIAGLPGEFPVMAADFRALEVTSLADLKNTSLFERVASVDAPFRELFVWAYLSAAGRPGMPDRDFGPWADAIMTEIRKDWTSEAAEK